MMKKIRYGVFGFCILVLFLTGCAGGTKIVITQEKYTPSFKAGDYKYYKGKKLVLGNFFNQAQNTKTYNYFSPDSKLNYEGNVSLESLYWYGFQKSFKYIGVKLVDYTYDSRRPYRHRWWWGAAGPSGYRAPKGVPEFQLILLSMTDQELKFKVVVFKDDEQELDKDYTVTMAAAGTENKTDLEKRGYALLDLAFTTVMNDRDFRKVF